jgi:hypothetical protein
MDKRIVALLAMTVVSPGALGQNSPKKDAPTPEPTKVSVPRGQTIGATVAAMAKTAGTLAAVDPSLTGTVSAATAKLPIEKGLSLIAAENGAVWRKVYLSENEIPLAPDGSVDVRHLMRIVESVTPPTVTNVGVVDPATGQLSVLSRAAEGSPGMVEWAKTRKAVYLLYKPGKTAASRGAGSSEDMLPPGGIEAFKEMTPQERQDWMKAHGGIIVTSDMSSDERAQVLQTLSPDERARIEDKMNQAGQNGGHSVVIMKNEETTK